MAKWLDRFLTDEDITKISQAVHGAEEKTTGEIVPVIVHRSSAIGHVPLSLTLIFLLIIMFFEFPWKDILFVAPWIYLWPLLAIVLYVFSYFLSRSHIIQRILVPNFDEASQAFRRAQLEFYLNGVNDTKQATGILIFVSVMERRAVILADKGIAERIPPEAWQVLVDKLSQRLRKGEWSAGFQDCISECGVILTAHFPRNDEAHNELRNDLVIKE